MIVRMYMHMCVLIESYRSLETGHAISKCPSKDPQPLQQKLFVRRPLTAAASD